MALYTKLSKKQIAKLVAPFGLSAPKRIQGILEGTVNTYYRLDYPQKSYFLKIDETSNIQRLKRELKVFKILAANTRRYSFKIPTPLPTLKGKLFVFFGKKPVLLFETIPGHSANIKTLTYYLLRNSGRAMAQLHRSAGGKKLEKHRFFIDEIFNVYKQIKNKLKVKHPLIDASLRNWLLWMEQNEPNGLPEGLIHADLFAENILLQNGRLMGIVDFEAAGRGPFLFDIAVSLHALCHDGKSFSISHSREFLKGYQSIRKLIPKEKKELEYYLFQSALRFLLTRLRDFELKEGPVKAKPFKDYREFLKRFSEIPPLLQRIQHFLHN